MYYRHQGHSTTRRRFIRDALALGAGGSAAYFLGREGYATRIFEPDLKKMDRNTWHALKSTAAELIEAKKVHVAPFPNVETITEGGHSQKVQPVVDAHRLTEAMLITSYLEAGSNGLNRLVTFLNRNPLRVAPPAKSTNMVEGHGDTTNVAYAQAYDGVVARVNPVIKHIDDKLVPAGRLPQAIPEFSEAKPYPGNASGP